MSNTFYIDVVDPDTEVCLYTLRKEADDGLLAVAMAMEDLAPGEAIGKVSYGITLEGLSAATQSFRGGDDPRG